MAPRPSIRLSADLNSAIGGFQPGPLHRVLALLDPLLHRAATVVEFHHPVGRASEVRHDETDAREQLAFVMLDLCRHPARFVPTAGLVQKTVKPDDRLVGPTAHQPRQQGRTALVTTPPCDQQQLRCKQREVFQAWRQNYHRLSFAALCLCSPHQRAAKQ